VTPAQRAYAVALAAYTVATEAEAAAWRLWDADLAAHWDAGDEDYPGDPALFPAPEVTARANAARRAYNAAAAELVAWGRAHVDRVGTPAQRRQVEELLHGMGRFPSIHRKVLNLFARLEAA
jgi:hypothetical protein